MNYVKLGDLCEIKSGKRLPQNCDFADRKTQFPYIRARDIKNGRISTEDLVYIEADVQKRIKKYIIEKDDIAITIVGASVGDVGYAEECVNGYNLTENAVRLTSYNEKVYSKYLFYVLYQKQYRDYMQLIAGAAAQPKLGIYKIKQICVELPEMSAQIKIASIISQHDALIENNNKRIKLLEQMAENLYKEWFVRFRFPDYQNTEFENSALGKIPKTFSVVKIKDVIDDYIGGGWGNDDSDKSFSIGAYVIRGTDFPNIKKGNISSCPFRYHKASNYSSRRLKKDDIIIEVSGGTAEQPVGRTIIIPEDIINRFGGKVICASFCKMLRLKHNAISPMYFIYWMNYLYQSRIIDKFQLQSTGIINFKFEYFLRKGDVLLPSQDIMIDFANKVKKIKDQINKIAEISDNLIKQRDMLLPRLMSGKLELK